MKEEWRAVVGYKGRYEVSDSGRVRSVNRAVRVWFGTRDIRGITLAPIVAATGYHVVSLCRDGARKQARVHVLVLESFISRRPRGLIGCHKDGKRLNNTVDNLKWDTYKNNFLDTKRHGTALLGERAPAAKLTNAMVRKIRKRDKTAYAWARELGMSLRAICLARSGITWGHIK